MPEAKTQKQLTYKEREVRRARLFVEAMTRLDDAAEAAGLKQAARDLISTAATAVEQLQTKLLQGMPDDFKGKFQLRSNLVLENDVVSPIEEFADLYQKNDHSMTVKEVIKKGGNEEGKGGRFFLKCKRADGTIVTVPSAHFAVDEE